LRVVGHSRQAPANLQWLVVARQDGDPIPGRLTIPQRTIPRSFQFRPRKVGTLRLQFLQADDVGLLPLQPLQEDGQPGTNAVDVIGRKGKGGYGVLRKRL